MREVHIRRGRVAGVTVICTGGSGIPRVRQADGSMAGIEAVVEGRASALLATGLATDVLLLLTDVDAAYLDFGTPQARAIVRADPQSLQARQFEFRAGSMAPKIEGAITLVAATGHLAGIGRLEDAGAILAGTAGTLVDRRADRI